MIDELPLDRNALAPPLPRPNCVTDLWSVEGTRSANLTRGCWARYNLGGMSMRRRLSAPLERIPSYRFLGPEITVCGSAYRKSLVSGKSVSVRLTLGCCRVCKQKKFIEHTSSRL